MKDELRKYINDNYEKSNVKTSFLGRLNDSFLSKLQSSLAEEDFDYCDEKEASICNKRKKHTDISSYIKEHNNYNDFQALLFKIIDEKHLKDSDVYNKVHIDRRLFSKIRSSKNYHPSKDTIILLGLSLELNEDEITALLESASYSLPKNNYFDLIIRFCFIKGIYKISDVNELLNEYGCKMFNY